jgi:hypothetical protein
MSKNISISEQTENREPTSTATLAQVLQAQNEVETYMYLSDKMLNSPWKLS